MPDWKTHTALVERVTTFFAKHPRESFRSRQVAKRLGVKGDEAFQDLREVLHGMVAEGALHYGRQRGYRRATASQGIVGRLAVTKRGFGIVSAPGSGFDEIYVDSRSLSTALHGDTVEVAILARKRKREEGERVEGEIIRVVSRDLTHVVGTLEQSRNFYHVVPDDQRITRDIYIPSESLNGAKPGMKVVAALEEWHSELMNPEGRVVEVLGRAGDYSAEVESVIRAFRLPLKFPAAVEEEAAAIPGDVTKEELHRRKDLRSVPTFTIDPEDAKDFDDALSIEKGKDGSWILGVHIADVSAYVREGTALDAEAYKRGTSVYLANQVVPMLPERLSNDLCSLKPDVDRLTFSCIMEVSPKGKVESYEIRRTVIHSSRRFTYEEVENILDRKRGDHAEELLALWKLASLLRELREKNGSIDFDTPEAKFRYDTLGKPVEVKVKERLKSHRLVEECMLLANRTVARHIGMPRKESAPRPFIYRIHDFPDREKLAELAAFVQKFGYRLNVGQSVTSKALQALLHEAEGTAEENVINEVALRSMARAVYSTENIGHFGLGFDFYTHFTSPIRRYPDLIVHRLVDAYAHGEQALRKTSGARLTEMCRWLSERERNAAEAERESVKVMQAEYMKRHLGEEFEGVISGVSSYGIFVELKDLLVEGMIHVRNIGDDYYVHDEKRYSLVGQRTRRAFRLGDTVDVKVLSVDVERRTVDFALAEEGTPVRHRPKGGRRKGGRKSRD